MANTFNLGNGNWAQKTEKLLAYNAENNNYKPLPFDFDRASTATRVNKQGLIETVGIDEPRIDFLNNSKGHLLLEPQRQNIITYSEDFSEWSLGQGGTGSVPVITSNNAISPDGNNTADKVVLDMNGGTTSSDFSFITIGYTSSATTFTLSCYLKGVNGGEEIFFDFDNQNSNLITLTTEWVRYDFTKTVSATGTRLIRIGLRGGSTTDDTASFYAWGAQLEQGSYATSYIPTSGQSGGVTRSAETCKQENLLTDIINASYPFTLYVDGKYNGQTSSLLSFSRIDSAQQYFLIHIFNNQVLFLARSNGTSEQIQSGIDLVDGQEYKIAATMESATSGKICVNGNSVTVKNDFSSQIQNSDITDLLVGQVRVVTDDGIRSPVSGVKLYNTALTDAELIALTS